MPLIAVMAALIAAALHVLFPILESATFTNPRVAAGFGPTTPEQVAAVRPMAFNQGFYNLFLAVGVVGGLALVAGLGGGGPGPVQAVSRHLRVLERAGLVSRRREAQRRPVHLELEAFDLMTTWIERYRRQAEARYQRLDALLADLPDGTEGDAT